MAVYRILSIDGGGIRGIISTILLERLSAEPSLSGWLGNVDFLAGTSTGGLLALGGYVVLAGADYVDSPRIKWLDRVSGVRRTVEGSLKTI